MTQNELAHWTVEHSSQGKLMELTCRQLLTRRKGSDLESLVGCQHTDIQILI